MDSSTGMTYLQNPIQIQNYDVVKTISLQYSNSL